MSDHSHCIVPVKMTALLALGLVTAIQGVLSASTTCSGDIKAKTRDGNTCYECGKSRITTTTTEQWSTVGRLPASQGDFPWNAAIYKSPEWKQVCGGTLISSQAVLTAAICVTTLLYQPLNISDIQVVLGSTYRSWNASEPSWIKQQIKEIRVHPDFKGHSVRYANDIALLILDSKVPFSSAVLPACLDFNLNTLPPYEKDSVGYVAGFGNVAECGHVYPARNCYSSSEKLTYTSTNVLSFDQCFNVTQTLEPTVYTPLTTDKICIGNSTVAPIRNSDAGAGFTVISHGLHYVTGVASVKILDSKYSFSTLTDVPHHMNWIKNNLPE